MSQPIPEPARRYPTFGRVDARTRGLTVGQVEDAQTGKDLDHVEDLRDYPEGMTR